MKREFKQKQRRNEPHSAFTLSGFAVLAFLLLLLVLKEASPLAFLYDSGFHDLSPEAVEQPLLGLVLVNHHLHVVRRAEEERVCLRVRRVHYHVGGQLRWVVILVLSTELVALKRKARDGRRVQLWLLGREEKGEEGGEGGWGCHCGWLKMWFGNIVDTFSILFYLIQQIIYIIIIIIMITYNYINRELFLSTCLPILSFNILKYERFNSYLL